MHATVSKVRKQIQRGFTLVEIAIVLVIIGLLIGGVLRGQELINSARVNNITNQTSAVNTAYYGFIDRYKSIPGDLTAAQALMVNNATAPASASGDGNVTPPDSVAFFNNLAQAGFLSCSQCSTNAAITVGSSTTTAATYTAAGASQTNSLTNAFAQPMIFIYNTGLTTGSTAVTGSATAGSISFMDANGSTSKPLLYTGTGITNAMLAEIDRKVDDGTPSTGNFRYTDVQGTSATAATFSTAAASALCWNGAGTAASPYTWIASPAANCQGVLLF